MKCDSITKCESLCLCSRCLMLDICSARPWRSCSRPDGSPIIAWLDTYTPPTTVQRCDGSAP